MITYVTCISSQFDRELLPFLVKHYTRPFIKEHCATVHFPDRVDEDFMQWVRETCPGWKLDVWRGPFYAMGTIDPANRWIKQATQPYILRTDSDELLRDIHSVPGRLDSTRGPIWAIMIDRWYKIGVCKRIEPDRPLAEQYPLKDTFTMSMGAGRKPILFRRSRRLRTNHQLRGSTRWGPATMVLDHYKWTHTRRERIEVMLENLDLTVACHPGRSYEQCRKRLERIRESITDE